MANKKISELESRASLSLSDLMAVGDPSTGYLYKTTISDLKTLTGAGVVSFNGRFGTVNPAEGDYTLTQLGDVIITSPSNGQVLKYNGSNWVNASDVTEADTLDTVTTRGNTTANSITVGSVTAAGLSNLLGQIKTFVTTGNTYIGANPGSATDAGYKLDVNGTIRSTGAFYGTQLLTGSHSFRDQMYITATTDGWTKQSAYNAASAFTMGFVGDLRFAPSAAIKAVFSFNGTYSNNGTIYAGDSSLIKIFTGDAFGNTIGATTYNGYGINLMPTLNYTTGTSNFTGIYYNPTLTATTGLTHYAMNLVAGLVRMGTLAGTGSRIVVADASGNLSASSALTGYVTLDTFQTITASKTFSVGFSLASAGGANQLTSFANANSIHSGSADTNVFGFNSSNNIYFGKGLSNGGVIAWNNSVVRSYTLPNADGTIALTSDIPSVAGVYLPLAGGTLTGALGGTSAAFTSSGSGDTFAITHSSGSGIALNITKGGNGEGLYINKTSGTGNAATIIGTLNATTLVKSGGTSSQFLKADGSVDSNTYLTSASVAGVYLPLSGGTLTGALGGTSASFTGTVTAASTLYLGNDGTYGATYKTLGFTGTTNGTHRIFAGTADNLYIAAASGRGIVFWTDGSSGTKVSIDTTGAATFSSSLTAAGSVGVGGTNTDSLFTINGTAGTAHARFREGSTTVGFIGGANGITTGANGSLAVRAENGLVLSGAGNSLSMFINASGNVGIGTTNPDERLTIGSGNGISIRTVSGGTYGAIKFGTSNSAYYSEWAGIDSDWEGQGVNVANLRFYTSFGARSERMRITAGGELLVGTTNSYTSRLNVQSTSASVAAIKAGYGAVSGNGYTILADNYTLSESLMSIGIDYSSGGLVLGSCLAPSTTVQGAFISTQAQFGGAGSAIRLSTSGEILFYNGTQSSVVSVGSAKSASLALTIAQTGVATFTGDVKVKTLEITNVGTDSTSSGVSTYMQITVNGNPYLIPLHGTP